jgi:HlyD family secretion protein
MGKFKEWKNLMRNKILFILSVLGASLAVIMAIYASHEPKALPPAFKPATNPYANGIYAQGIIEAQQNSGENINIYPEVSGVITKVLVKEGDQVKSGDPIISFEDSVQRSLVAQANLAFYQKQYEAARALLAKYQIHALSDGKILSINASVGSYVSPQGVYGTYTQAMNPLIVMGGLKQGLAVRCFIDEILIQKLPNLEKINAYMSIRGSDHQKIPLKFIRVQPNVSPKIQLSDQRSERVDVRVLPVIFSFDVPKDLKIYTGQLVDVYIGQ